MGAVANPAPVMRPRSQTATLQRKILFPLLIEWTSYINRIEKKNQKIMITCNIFPVLMYSHFKKKWKTRENGIPLICSGDIKIPELGITFFKPRDESFQKRTIAQISKKDTLQHSKSGSCRHRFSISMWVCNTAEPVSRNSDPKPLLLPSSLGTLTLSLLQKMLNFYSRDSTCI